MPLSPGQRLGAYEIVDPVGAGGMGEVYRARDTRLQRMVAIKIVAAAVGGNADALARFEREAQAVAALSHPNILAIHDFGQQDGVTYAVMELLEGRSLAEVVSGGPLPLRKAIDYAKQIADGLAAAHDRGIIHRDIKPGNIFVNNDGRVTILDFGLARITGPAATENSATVSLGSTPGLIVGTVGYMSPEQVRGQALDHRSDIFSFGTVLYEMLSGRRAFGGATAADTMSAILNAEPADIEGVPAPPALDRIIHRCLEKEPGRRFQSTRDLGFALESLPMRSESSAAGLVAPPSPRSRVAVVAVACLVSGALGAGLVALMRAPAATAPAPSVVRFQIPSPFGMPPWVAVSPTGEALAWGASLAGESGASVFFRHLNQAAAVSLPDSSGSVGGFWRPDGRQLLIFRNGQVFSLNVETSTPTPVLDGRTDPKFRNFRGAALGPGDQLLVGGTDSILLAGIGRQESLKEIARADKAIHSWYGYPQWLPDGRLLYMAQRADGTALEAFVRQLSGAAPSRIDLPPDISRVIVDPQGGLLYGRSGTLLGQRFDLRTLKPEGEPVSLATNVVSDRTGPLAVDVSRSGVLAYRTSSFEKVQFEWVDRAGRALSKLGPEEPYINFDLAPDGVRVAALRRDGAGNETSMWILDDRRSVVSRIADGLGAQTMSDPTWSPDGQRLAYRRGNTVVVRNTFGGDETVMANWRGYPDSWSRDGRYLAVGRPAGPNFDLVAVPVDQPAEAIPLVTGVTADEPRFSPDGKWVAYHVTADGQSQVYVTPFPPTGEQFQVSAAGGVQPRWRGDGKELYFLDRDGNLVSVAIPNGKPRDAQPGTVLFRSNMQVSPINDQFAVSADGSRFLLRRTVGGPSESPISVILNWRQLLK